MKVATKNSKPTKLAGAVKPEKKKNVKEKFTENFNSLAGILKEEIKKGIVKPFNRKEIYGN